MVRLALLGLVLLAPGCSDDSSVSNDARVHDAQHADRTPTDQTLSDRSPVDQKGVDTSVSDGPIADGPVADLGAPDSPPGVDGSYPALFKDIEGIWLVGWSGGMNHYSWVRFTVTSSFGGTAVILDGQSLFANVPYWSCSGATSWNLASKPDTIQLHFPSSTCVPQGLKSSSYTFSNIKPATGSWPKGATHTAQVTTSLQPTSLEGHRFPKTQCDAAMTSCTDPL